MGATTTKGMEYLGVPLTSQKIVPGATPTGIDDEVYTYVERTLAYTSGGTTEIQVGDTIVGATSSAVADVVAITLTGGTWGAGSASGVLTLKNQVGTFQSESIKVGAGTNDATIAGNSTVRTDEYSYKGHNARAVLFQATGQSALVAFDGSNPNQTYKKGITVTASSFGNITEQVAIRKFRCIDETSGSATTVNIVCYF
jgi:hypothetical protein